MFNDIYGHLRFITKPPQAQAKVTSMLTYRT